MKLKTKTNAIKAIRPTNISSVGNKKYGYFVSDCGTDNNGKRIRICRRSRQECIDAIEDYYASVEIDNGAKIGLTPEQAAEALCAFSAVDKAGLEISLLGIVLDYVSRHKNELLVKTTLQEAYNKYYNSFERIQVMHLKCVKARVGRFVATMPTKLVHEVTADDVVSFLDSLGDISPKTYNNFKQYISSFFPSLPLP